MALPRPTMTTEQATLQLRRDPAHAELATDGHLGPGAAESARRCPAVHRQAGAGAALLVPGAPAGLRETGVHSGRVGAWRARRSPGRGRRAAPPPVD